MASSQVVMLVLRNSLPQPKFGISSAMDGLLRRSGRSESRPTNQRYLCRHGTFDTSHPLEVQGPLTFNATPSARPILPSSSASERPKRVPLRQEETSQH